MTRSLIVENLCVHGYPQPHGYLHAKGECMDGKVVTLLDGQAIRLKHGEILDVAEIMDAVLADTARPSVT